MSIPNIAIARACILVMVLTTIAALTGCSTTASSLVSTPVTSAPLLSGTSTATNTMAITATLSPTTVPTVTAAPSHTVTSTPARTPMPTTTPTPLPLPVTDKVTFELLNHQGGLAESIAVEGEIAYLGMGPRLVVLNVAHPETPQLIGQSGMLPGLVKAVLVRDGMAYLGVGTHLVALDVYEPSAIAVIGELALPGLVTRLALKDNILVVGMGIPFTGKTGEERGAIATIDLSRPGQLDVSDLIELPWFVQGLTMVGESVYAGNPNDDTLYAADIDASAGLDNLVALPSVGPVYSLWGYGERLYVGGYLSDVSAWDISAPLEPRKLWETRPTVPVVLGIVQDFVPVGEYIYLSMAYGDAGVYTANATAIKAPEPVEGTPKAAISTRVVVQEGLMWVADAEFTIYDIADPENITSLGTYALPSVQDVAIAGNTGVIVHGGSRQVMDNSSLYTLSLPDLKVLGQYVDESRDTSCRSSLIQVTVKEDRAYVGAWEDGMRILNLANLYTPTLTGSLDKTNGFRRLWILGNIAVVDERAYVGAYFGDKPWLAIFDLAGPGDPKVSAQVSLGGEVDRIALTDKIVYAGVTYADREGSTLYLLDATSTEPRQLGAIELSSRIYDVWTQDHLVIIATSDGISIGSVRDPNSPQTIAELPVPGGAYRMALLADTVLATTAQYVGSGQLLAVDLSGPTNPNLIGTFDLPAGRTKIYASDEYVLVGNEPMGLAVLRIDLNGDMPPN